MAFFNVLRQNPLLFAPLKAKSQGHASEHHQPQSRQLCGAQPVGFSRVFNGFLMVFNGFQGFSRVF